MADPFSEAIGVGTDVFDSIMKGLQFQQGKKEFGKEFGLAKRKDIRDQGTFDLSKAVTLTGQAKAFEDTDWKRRFRKALQ